MNAKDSKRARMGLSMRSEGLRSRTERVIITSLRWSLPSPIGIIRLLFRPGPSNHSSFYSFDPVEWGDPSFHEAVSSTCCIVFDASSNFIPSLSFSSANQQPPKQ